MQLRYNVIICIYLTAADLRTYARRIIYQVTPAAPEDEFDPDEAKRPCGPDSP